MTGETKVSNHIVLTSHPTGDQKPIPLQWGAADVKQRGPVVVTPAGSGLRNAIGSYSGSYSVYRALAVAAGNLDPLHKPDLTNTAPAVDIGRSGLTPRYRRALAAMRLKIGPATTLP